MTRTALGQGGKGQIAWKRLDALTDEDITQTMAEDPDPVWLKISDVSPSLKWLRLGVYWIEQLRYCFQTEERL